MRQTKGDAPAYVAGDSIFDRWLEFRTIFERAHVSPSELERVRQAFYCGAVASFSLILEAGAPGSTPELVTARLDALRDELDGFRFDIRRPEATS